MYRLRVNSILTLLFLISKLYAVNLGEDYTPNKEPDDTFSYIQTDPTSGTSWCAIAPNYTYFGLDDKLDILKDWYLNNKTFSDYCRSLRETPCGRYLDSQFNHILETLPLLTEITENQFYETVQETYYCVDLIATTKKPNSQLKCDENEFYSECGTSCEPTCNEVDIPYFCEDDVCELGCFCSRGYVRDSYRNCVLKEDCLEGFTEYEVEFKKTDGNITKIEKDTLVVNLDDHSPSNITCQNSNEIYTNCLDCEDTCEFFDFITNELPVRKCACTLSGCTCKPGYARVNGFCIEAKLFCKDLECSGRPNENFQACYGHVSVCKGSEDCANRDEFKKEENDEKSVCDLSEMPSCQPGCICNEGYSRNNQGYCIRNKECGRCFEQKFDNEISTTLVGGFTPQCEGLQDVWYNPLQFHSGTGERWCAIVPKYSFLPISSKYIYKMEEVLPEHPLSEISMKPVGLVNDEPGLPAAIILSGSDPSNEPFNLPTSLSHEDLIYYCNEMAVSECALELENILKEFDEEITDVVLSNESDRLTSCQKLIQNTPKFPISCPVNQIYNSCGTSSSCEDTCQTVADERFKLLTGQERPGKINKICNKMCVEGCFCEKGYVKNNENDCILVDECPVQPEIILCEKENEEHTECLNCEITCESYNSKMEPEICNCQTKGCTCIPGYARHNGHCIKAEQHCENINCQGRVNEIFHSCDGHQCGPNTCESLTGPQIMCRMFPGCSPGCLCEPGFYRDDKKNCISINECGRCTPTLGATGLLGPLPDLNLPSTGLSLVAGAAGGAVSSLAGFLNKFQPKCDRSNTNSYFSLVQKDPNSKQSWCTIIPKYSYLPASSKFTYEENEISPELLLEHCQEMIASDCNRNLENYFYNATYNAGQRTWPEITKVEMKKAVENIPSCVNMILATPKIPKILTNCEKQKKRFAKVKIDVKTVFLPECDEEGNYKLVQNFNSRSWCVKDVETSPEPVMLYMKFYQKLSNIFCENLPDHICYDQDTFYCKNQICNLADKNMVYLPCSNDCLQGTCSNTDKSKCTAHCYGSCFCRPGYILDEKSRNCVRKDHCQLPCDKAALYRTPNVKGFTPTCGPDGKGIWSSFYIFTKIDRFHVISVKTTPSLNQRSSRNIIINKLVQFIIAPVII